MSLDVISVPALLAVFDYCSDLCLNASVREGLLNDVFILFLDLYREMQNLTLDTVFLEAYL